MMYIEADNFEKFLYNVTILVIEGRLWNSDGVLTKVL